MGENLQAMIRVCLFALLCSICYGNAPTHDDCMRLYHDPDNVTYQQTFLTKLQSICPKKHETKGQLILGLGSGRCGSLSLANLLRAQEGCYSTHESLPHIQWKGGESRLFFHKKRLDMLLKTHPFVVEVAHYYLPYFEQIIKWYPKVRVIVLKRNRAATIASFEKAVPHLNHWMNTGAKPNVWDEMFPNFEASSRAEAIGMYWDLYYKMIDELIKKYPEHVRLYAIEDLNNPLKQMEMLEFCGIKLPRVVTNLHHNAWQNRQ